MSPIAPQPDTKPQPASMIAPLLAWLILQLLALAISVFRIPLAVHFHDPAEDLALAVMAVTQAVGSSLLFPWLMRDRWAAVVTIATSWAMLALAGVLAQAETSRVIGIIVHLSIWMTGLALWRHVLRRPRAQMSGVAIAALLAIGFPAISYLAAEFGNDAMSDAPLPPTIGGLQLLANSTGLLIWILVLIPLLLAASHALLIIKRGE